MALIHQQLRRVLAAALNDHAAYVASAGTTSSFTSVLLIDSTTGASPNRLKDAWAYIATGATVGGQSRVKSGGLTPASGLVAVTPTWAAPVPGAEIEITRLFPAVSSSAVPTAENVSYRTVINRALQRMLIPDQITLSSVAGQYAYSLNTYAAWLTDRERILALYDPPMLTGYPPRENSRNLRRLDFDAGVPTLYLQAAYAGTDEPIRLDVIRPASTWVNDAETHPSVGVSAETDSVLSHVRLDEFLVIGLAEAYKALAAKGHDGRNWAAMAAEQEPLARATVARLERRSRGLPEEAPQMAGAA